jgi:hypothetical protein
VCGDALAFDEALPTVADFDLWLRLASLPIVRVFDVLADVRVGPQSSTWTADSYERHCHFKLVALRRFVAGRGRDLLVSKIMERAEAGIYLWALDSMAVIGATQDYIDRYFQLALDTDLRSERFRRIVNAAHPAMPAQHPRRDDVLALGIEYLRKRELTAALTYFELLQSWNVPAATLQEVSVYRKLSVDEQLELCDELLSSAARDENRRNQALTDLRQTLHAEMHHDLLEMNKREQQAAEVISGLRVEIDQHLKRCEHLQANVQTRDEIIDDLRARLPGNRIRRFLHGAGRIAEPEQECAASSVVFIQSHRRRHRTSWHACATACRIEVLTDAVCGRRPTNTASSAIGGCRSSISPIWRRSRCRTRRVLSR